jgi:iron complex transport system ATP-binding protein
MVALIGSNGAGKSTLLRTMNRTHQPWRGQVALHGRDLWQISPRQCAKQIALVEQTADLAWPYTVEQVLNLGRFPHQGWFAFPKAQDSQVVQGVLQQTGLTPFRQRLLHTLSGGERQRVMIARAMVQQPQILLLDEPSANLDLNHQHRLLEFVRKLVDEQALTVVTAIHDLALAARYCDRAIVLHQGRLYADGCVESVFKPALFQEVFNVQAQLYRDPLNHHWALSVH